MYITDSDKKALTLSLTLIDTKLFRVQTFPHLQTITNILKSIFATQVFILTNTLDY